MKSRKMITIILIMGIITELTSCKATQYITIHNTKTVNNGKQE